MTELCTTSIGIRICDLTFVKMHYAYSISALSLHDQMALVQLENRSSICKRVHHPGIVVPIISSSALISLINDC